MTEEFAVLVVGGGSDGRAWDALGEVTDGLTVRSIAEPAAAAERLAADGIDYVLVDGTAPAVAVPDSLEPLIEHAPEGRVMVVSDDHGAAVAALETGVDDWLPADVPDELVAARIAAAHGWEVRLRESDAGGARFEFVGVSGV